MDWVAILSTDFLPYTEHNRSRNMEATFRGNHKNVGYPSCICYYRTYTEHIRYRNVETTFRGNHETLGIPSCNGYYIY